MPAGWCRLNHSDLILQFALGSCYISGNHCQSLGSEDFSLIPKAFCPQFPPSVYAHLPLLWELHHSKLYTAELNHHRKTQSSTVTTSHTLQIRKEHLGIKRRKREALKSGSEAYRWSSSSSPPPPEASKLADRYRSHASSSLQRCEKRKRDAQKLYVFVIIVVASVVVSDR